MLKKRGSVWWIDTRVDGTRIRISTKCRDLGEAQRVAPGIIASQLEEEVEKSGTGMVLSAGFQRIFEEEWNGLRDVANLRVRSAEIEGILGPKTRLEDIDRAELVRLQKVLGSDVGRDRRKPCSPATVNRKMAIIMRLLNVAMKDWEVLDRVPSVRPLKTPKTKMRGLTDAEIIQLLGLVPEPVAQVFKFLIESGLRRGEWAQLEWRHINFDSNHIHIDPRSMAVKAVNERRVPLTPSCRVLLSERRSRGLRTPFGDVGVDCLRYHWRKAREEMGLTADPGFVIHSLRHTCATRLIDQGVPTLTVQKWLGHTNIQTTEKYVQQSDESLQKYVQAVEVEAGPKLRALG